MCGIRGAAHCNVHTTCDWQRVDQPHAVFCIISNRRVTGRAVGSTTAENSETNRRVTGRAVGSTTAENSETGQVTVSPCRPAIQRGRPTDIVSAPAGDAGYLKRGHNGIPICESTWFYFRHVLGGRIGEAILAELSENA